MWNEANWMFSYVFLDVSNLVQTEQIQSFPDHWSEVSHVTWNDRGHVEHSKVVSNPQHPQQYLSYFLSYVSIGLYCIALHSKIISLLSVFQSMEILHSLYIPSDLPLDNNLRSNKIFVIPSNFCLSVFIVLRMYCTLYSFTLNVFDLTDNPKYQ